MAGNSMSKILGSFNSANLGDVANTGVMENARNEAQTILNNFKANDAVGEMAYKEEASELTRDFRSAQAGMERSAARTGAWMDGIGAVAGGAMKGGGSLFGGGGPQMGGDNYWDPTTGKGVAGPNYGL